MGSNPLIFFLLSLISFLWNISQYYYYPSAHKYTDLWIYNEIFLFFRIDFDLIKHLNCLHLDTAEMWTNTWSHWGKKLAFISWPPQTSTCTVFTPGKHLVHKLTWVPWLVASWDLNVLILGTKDRVQMPLCYSPVHWPDDKTPFTISYVESYVSSSHSSSYVSSSHSRFIWSTIWTKG